jgi:hypothetical protein
MQSRAIRVMSDATSGDWACDAVGDPLGGSPTNPRSVRPLVAGGLPRLS